jgi:hypothetical protein
MLFISLSADHSLAMSESRRKSSHSSSEALSQLKDNQQVKHHHSGFVNKLISDLRKLYVYQPEQIKWMNEKPKHKKAYEPTEVRISISSLVFI